MTNTATQATGPVDAPASSDMASVLSEFAQDTSTPKDDAVQDAVRELTEQPGEGEAEEAPDTGESEVETPSDETEEADDGNPAEDGNEPDSNARYTVKVNGEEMKVSFAELKAGYSRNEDYKAKTMALADDRRTLDTEKSGYQQQAQSEYADKLEQATALFMQTDPLLAQAQSIDWAALAQDDPNTYTQLKAAVDQRYGAINQAQQQIAQAREAEANQRQMAISEGLVATEKAIRESNPEFADDAKFKPYVNDAVTELMNVGLDGDDLTAILSNPQVGPKALALVNDARAWRMQQKAKAELPEKRVTVKPAAKPLRSDASTGSQPRKAPPPNASMDTRRDWVVKELLESQGT